MIALETVATIGSEMRGWLGWSDHHMEGVEDVTGVAGWGGEY